MTGLDPMPVGQSSLHHHVVRGLGWSGLSQALRLVLQVGISVLLARLLPPADFGAIAMVMVFAGFAASFSDLGLSAALVQKKDLQPRHSSTAFCVQVLSGVFLAVLLAVAAPLISSFYRAPRLLPLCLGIAPTFIVSAWSGVPMALLQRTMGFRRIAQIETAAALLSGAVAVAMALKGFGVWSLVSQAFLCALLTSVLSARQSGWKTSFAFDRPAWRELRQFSVALTGYNVLNYGIRNLDNLIIGKFIGPAALGFYSRAYNLMLFPIKQMSGAVSRVMFSALSSIQDQADRQRQIYLRTTRLIALATFPLMAGMAVLAEPLILLLFGPSWIESAPILRVLAIVGMLQSVGTTAGWIYTSQGRTDIMFFYSTGAFIVYGLAFLIGIRWGVLGVAVAYAASNLLILWVPSWTLAGRLIGLTFPRMASNLAGEFACSAIMAAIVLGLRATVFPHPGPLQLTCLIATGLAAYLAMIHFARLPAYLDMRGLLRDHLPTR